MLRFLAEDGAWRNGYGAIVAGDVLRRKVQTAKSPKADGGAGAERAWRVGFARAARDMMHLPVDFLGVTIARLSLTEVLDLPPDRALILMLEGPEEGLGLLILSPDLLAAMIEVLTIGQCGTQPADPRKPTRTDAAMLSPLADSALINLEEALSNHTDLRWAAGFRYASFIEEARPLGLLLEDVAYRMLNAQLSVGQGARRGEMILVLPAEGRGPMPHLAETAISDAVARPVFAAALTEQVEGAACQMDAVIARLTLPLVDVMQLQPDAVLALPKAGLDQISVEGLDGRVVATGRLGQHRGARAVRLVALGAALHPRREGGDLLRSAAPLSATGTV